VRRVPGAERGRAQPPDDDTYGKERPLEICSDEACYARNRRAVTVVAGSVDLGS
jgi:hypothetical protein